MCKAQFVGSLLLILIRLGFNYAFNIEPVKLELLDDKFRVSLPNDPDIKWVAFNININKEFQAFEAGQLSGLAGMPQERQWSYEFQRSLEDTDVVYIWVAIQHNKVIFRDRQGPISVGALRDPNFVPPSISTTSDRTTTEETKPEPTPNFGSRLGSEPITGNKACFATITEVTSGDNKHCKGDIIFQDNFDQLDPQRWTNEVRIPLVSDDAEFVLYNGTAYVDKGILKLPASLYRGHINRGTVDLDERCTSVDFEECQLEAKSNFYLPPIISGRVNTKKSFNFKYGRVEVRAKLPKGDWLVPLISLIPSRKKYGLRDYKSGEIRVAFSRGNQQLTSDNLNINGAHLFGGVLLSPDSDVRHQFMVNVTLDQVNGVNEHFGNQFHLYSLIWKPDELLLAVDGYEYGKIRTDFKKSVNDPAWRLGGDNAPLDEKFYLTLGLSAGGHGDFPNHCQNKPWQNTSPKAISDFNQKLEFWHPTWEQPSLEVDFIRVSAI